MAVARWWVMAGLVVPMEVRFAIGALVVLDDVPRGAVSRLRREYGISRDTFYRVSGVVGVGGVGGVVAEVGAAAPHRVRLVVDADTGTALGNVEHPGPTRSRGPAHTTRRTTRRAPDEPQSVAASAVAADDTARRRVGDAGNVHKRRRRDLMAPLSA
jgi:hypothetical protein